MKHTVDGFKLLMADTEKLRAKVREGKLLLDEAPFSKKQHSKHLRETNELLEKLIPPTHALLRTTIEIAPVSSRSCAAACVFESPVCPLIDSTISSTSSPAAAAAPFGSSAATIGCTTSPAPHQFRSNPSSSRTNRIPRRT